MAELDEEVKDFWDDVCKAIESPKKDYEFFSIPTYLNCMISGYDSKEKEISDAALKYLSGHPEIVEQVKKVFLHPWVYDCDNLRRLKSLANSGKMDEFFDAKALIEQSQNNAIEVDLADDWLTSSHLMDLLNKDSQKVLDILCKDLQTDEKNILKNVVRACKANCFIGTLKYDDKEKFNQLQAVFDAKEMILEAKGGMEYKAYLDKKNDVKRILELDKLDFQLMDLCFSINSVATIAVLREDESIRKNAERLFSDCKTYMKQKELVKTFESHNITGFKALLQQSAENLKKLPAEEIFAAMDMDGVQAKYDLKELKQVTDFYYGQTAELSGRSPNSLLYYCSIGHDKYWNEYKLNMLDYVGKYKDVPVLEELLEEKLARAYAHYSYHEKAEFGSVSSVGIEAFEKRLYKEIEKDIDSPESQFYLKYAKDVFALQNYTGKYYELTAYLMENHFEDKPELCKSFVDGIKKLPVDYSNDGKGIVRIRTDAINSFKENLNSGKSKFYLKNATDIFVTKQNDGKNFTGYYRGFVAKLLEEFHETQPELCNKLCKDAAKIIPPKDAVYFYEIYPNKEFLPKIEEYVDKVLKGKHEGSTIFDLYEKAVKTKLPILDKAIDQLLTVKDIRFKNEPKEGINYTGLMEKIRKSGIEEICLYEDSGWMIEQGIFRGNKSIKSIIVNDIDLDAKELVGCSNLRGVTTYAHESKFLNPQELLKLPELQEIYGKIDAKDEDAFVKAILEEKPENLSKIELENEKKEPIGTSEQRIELMKKYPNLVIEINYSNKDEVILLGRNDNVRNSETFKKAMEKDVVAEYLMTVPKDKIPELKDLMDLSDTEYAPYGTVFAVLEHAKAEDYPAVLNKIATHCGYDEIKEEAEILGAITGGSFEKYIKEHKLEKKEVIDKLTKPMKSLRKGRTALDYMEEKMKGNEQFNDAVSRIFMAIGASAEDVKKIEGSENLAEAIHQLEKRQSMEKGQAAAMSAFEKWKATKGISGNR